MKAHRVFNIIMVILFALLISTPLIFINKTTGKVSIAENRVLSGFPNFTVSNKLNTHFNKEFESWFNDNLGFRDNFVKWNTIIQYKLFGKLTKSDTLIGKDQWLYYVTPDIIKDYQHLNLPSNSQLNQWTNALDRINKYLGDKHIPFITMINLDKKTIYPEHYPDSILKIGDISRTDILEKYITQNTTIDFFTPKNALINAKPEATVYSPRYDNGHWNNYGAFIGYQELMKKVKNYLPNVNLLTWEDFDISRYDRETKIYNAVSFTESDYSFKFKKTSNVTKIEGIFDDLNLTYSNLSYRFENKNKKLPKALILGDSYFYGFLIPDLAESFSELTFIHTDNIDKIESFISLVNPDIVIYENAERMLDHTMQVLQNTTENYTNYKVYKDLPIVNNKPLLWLDYSNNKPVEQQQTKIVIDNSKKVVNLRGWALDSNLNTTAGDIYLKVGDNYYPSIYNIPHTGVSTFFNNPELLKSGFVFNVNVPELINSGKFSLIIISKDKTFQYAPVEYQVEIK
ncbi:hypothetical protein [Paenibacillus sp. GP183]|uniref:alginate O-acetyltransferase AlgX-related protein n=1 Tax=Paenibacillus sp. GP183 TaxID=1882751 RepID=UPI00089B9B25|nr:hypothetical protein [Paenibacillus sp. GP183]SEC12693.1 SGNH hydrolase-like domain-containing protein, acetyltransferase AlgX [Paenibacillus sp. GP183]